MRRAFPSCSSVLNSDSLNEQQLYDFGIYRVRQQLAPVPGVTLPTPAGGKYRQIMVDIDPDKLLSRGLTPLDNRECGQYAEPDAAVGNGEDRKTSSIRCEPTQHRRTIDDLNKMPVKFANGATILLKDVAQVRDGSMVATEHRARGWPTLGLAQRDQERQCLDARGRQWRQVRLAGDPRRPRRPDSRSTSYSTSRYS